VILKATSSLKGHKITQEGLITLLEGGGRMNFVDVSLLCSFKNEMAFKITILLKFNND
jgi:hypothetical protein